MAIFNIIPDVDLSETWEFQTDILTTINNTENRISLREFPRLSLGSSYDNLTDAQRREQFQNIFSSIRGVFVTPYFQYSTAITANTNVGSNRVFFDRSFVPVAAGGRIVLFNPRTRVVETHFVAQMETDGCSLLTNVANSISSSWVITPGVLSRLEEADFALESITQNLSMTFNSYEEPALQREGSTAVLSSVLNGIPVLDRSFLVGADEDIFYDREEIDFGGRRESYSRWPHAIITGPRTFLIQRVFQPTEFDWWRLFFDTIKGAWKPFYISTQKPDLTLALNLVPNATTLRINENVQPSFLQFPAYSQIAIRYNDKTISYHRVTAVSGSGPYILTVSPNIPNNSKVTSVDKVSYLLKARAADTVRLSHGSTTTEISFDITGTR